MTDSKRHLFDNTEDAVAFGETATIEDMSAMLKRVVGIVLSKNVEIATELQLCNEAVHAFVKNEWYKSYCKNK